MRRLIGRGDSRQPSLCRLGNRHQLVRWFAFKCKDKRVDRRRKNTNQFNQTRTNRRVVISFVDSKMRSDASWIKAFDDEKSRPTRRARQFLYFSAYFLFGLSVLVAFIWRSEWRRHGNHTDWSTTIIQHETFNKNGNVYLVLIFFCFQFDSHVNIQMSFHI